MSGRLIEAQHERPGKLDSDQKVSPVIAADRQHHGLTRGDGDLRDRLSVLSDDGLG